MSIEYDTQKLQMVMNQFYSGLGQYCVLGSGEYHHWNLLQIHTQNRRWFSFLYLEIWKCCL